MKKILFILPAIILLAAGCNSSKQATVQTKAPITQNTNMSATTVPTSSPTSGQNTKYSVYSNAAFGISFEYPNAWINFPLMPNNGRDIVTFIPPNTGPSDISNSISLGYLSNSKKENLTDYFSGYRKVIGGTWTEFSQGEIRGFKAVFTNPNSVTVYYFLRPNSQAPIFMFSIAGTAVPFTSDLISSFHFTTPDGSPLPQGADYGVMF